MSKIVVIGSANMDTTHYLSTEFPEDLTQESINEIRESVRVLGGKGFNQARATKLQSEKDEIFFVGCIGKDEDGVKVLEELKRVGINYSGVKVLEGIKTDGRIINVDKNGENRMMGYGDCVKQLKPDLIDTTVLENSDIIVIQMKMPEETVKYLIEYCDRNNKQLIIDPTPPEKSSILVREDLELLKKATYLTPNEEEAFALVKYMEGKTLEEAKREFKETPKEVRLKIIEKLVSENPNIIATIGGDGVIYNNNGETVRKATYPTECKDSTGAGDTFNGAFIAAIARGEELDKAIEYGLMASSTKVRYEGAQNGVPTYEETKKALEAIEQGKVNNSGNTNSDDSEAR